MGDSSDVRFGIGVSVRRRICSKNSSRESKSRCRATSSNNLSIQVAQPCPTDPTDVKRLTCLIDRTKLEECSRRIYHGYVLFCRYSIVEAMKPWKNHSKMKMHLNRDDQCFLGRTALLDRLTCHCAVHTRHVHADAMSNRVSPSADSIAFPIDTNARSI